MEDFLDVEVRGMKLKFRARAGVFARGGLDDGTKLLLEKMKVKDGSLVADLGSGNGVVGMAAAKLNPNGHVHLLDDHLRSVNLAKENLELNKINAEVFLSDLFSAVEERTYQQIFSNPPQQLGNEFLEELIEQSCRHLKQNGELWLVIKKNLKPVFERMLEKVFGNSEIVASGREHYLIKSIRLKGSSNL